MQLLTRANVLAVLLGSLGLACSGGAGGDPDAPVVDPPDPPGPGHSEYVLEYGMNPSFQNWSSKAVVFADAMTRASEFVVVRGGSLTPELAPTIPLGEFPVPVGAGWPDLSVLASGEGAGAFLFSAMEGTIPDGRAEPFVLTWEGSGECRLVGTAVVGEGITAERWTEYFVDPTAESGNGNVAFVVTSSDPADPVRNAHVWLPGTETARPLLWQPYVELLFAMNDGEGPRSWRPLDWNRINSYGALDVTAAFDFDFAGRILTTSPSQGTRRGVCVEFQVALCNLLGSDLHFQLPHRAGISEADYDRFVLDAMRRIRFGSPAAPGLNGGQPFAGLDGALSLTIEYSNEIWNASSPSNTWFADRSRELGVNFHELVAQEIRHVWDMADAVFTGGDAPKVRHYVGGFIANAGFVHAILDALPEGTRVDALGPAAYFAPPGDIVEGWLVDAAGESCPRCPDVGEVIAASIETIDTIGLALKAHRDVALGWRNPDGSHPALELYEAGQSFLAGQSPWRSLAQEAQRHPDMYYAYVDHLIPTMVEAGVERVHWYSFMTEQNPDSGVSIGFGIWGGMDEVLTLPVIEPYIDEGLPKAAAVYRGPPRVRD